MTTPNKDQKLTPLQRKVLSRKLLEAEIIARAWEDDAFRKKLTTYPVTALSEVGLPLPEGKTIKVVTELPNSITFILPPLPAKVEEAADEELETVAGGGIFDGGVCHEAMELKQLKRSSSWRKHEQAEDRLAKFKLEWFIGKSWAWG